MTALSSLFAFVTCYVGSGTGSPDLQAIHVLECNDETGEARIVQNVDGIQGTTYFQLDAAGKNLYSCISEKSGGDVRSAVVRFPIESNGCIGKMERVAGLTSETPCHISLSPDGSRIFCASYLSATVSSLAADGSDLKTYVFPDDDIGSNEKRQKKAYAHFAFSTLRPPYKLGVIDLGCDRLRFFDPQTLTVESLLEVKFDRGDGPRHAVWSKDGRFLFVVAELGSAVYSFAFDGKRFTRVGRWSMLPEGFNRWDKDGKTLVTKASAIKLTSDGKLLMASNRGFDSIAFFSVDQGSGMLERKSIAPLRGSFPRDFELMPGERFMIVGHKMSNEIQVYRFDRVTGSLDPAGSPIKCWRPLCFKFAKRGSEAKGCER